jgi:putative ABC transport system permease protein
MKRWRDIFTRKNDVDEEIASHIEMSIRDRTDRGESPEQARISAMREFGNIPLILDVDAAMSGGLWLDRLVGDIRYALRQLTNAPGFAITAILTLALAIGANSAVFTLVHAILLRELPFNGPSRVFNVENADAAGLGYDNIGGHDYVSQFNGAATSLKTLDTAAIYSSSGVNVGLARSGAQRLNATETSAQFLKVLGVTPELGRGFLPDEDVPGRDHVVLISDQLWRSVLHGDPDVAGKVIRVNTLPFSVIGVLPPQMDFPANTDLWTPTILDDHSTLHEPGAFITQVIVRGRDGITASALRSEFHARAAQKNHGHLSKDQEPILTPIADELTKSVRSSLWMLSGAVAFVLLIACANVACLSLVRTAQRRAEFAVRAALGAGRGRLMQQQLVESIFVALAGGLLGVCIAYSMLHLLYVFRPAALDGFAKPAIDLQVLAFTAAVALCTGLIFGIVPAWLASREDPAGALKSGVWRSSPGGSRLRKALIAAEIAMAFVLLMGAGLMLRTLANMNRIPLGYQTDGILTFSVSLHGKRYYAVKDDANPALPAFYSAVLDRLAALPGVASAGAVSNLPLDTRAAMLLHVDAGKGSKPASALPRFASRGYFGAMGIPFLAGRDFSAADNSSSPRVVIVTRDLAQKIWPAQNPLGRQMHCDWFCKTPPIVIGVISPSRSFGPRADALPEYFMPYTQQDWPFMTFVLRTHIDPATLVPSVRAAVAAADPAQPVYDIRTMQQRLEDNESLIRFEVFTLSIFAILSVVLVAIGLYGVISYAVTQRTREIGLRIALGSPRAAILVAVVRESALICLVGVVAGLASSFLLMRLLETTLFGVQPHDPATLGTVSALFLMIATLASYLPAHRAASIDPAQTLRME